MTGIASYFRQSGLRTRELRALAEGMGLKVYSMPRYFDVRWAEFTYSLCRAIAGSWQAIVLYLKSGVDSEAKPFLSKWTEYGRVQLLCFVSDVTFVFSRFQKSLQSGGILLSDIPAELVDIVSKLRRMHTAPVLGGWEALFASKTTFNTNGAGQVNVSGQDETRNVAWGFQSTRTQYQLVPRQLVPITNSYLFDSYPSQFVPKEIVRCKPKMSIT